MLADELDEPSMTPQEIEAVVGNVRERVQDSIDWVRAVADTETAYAASESMRTVADAVQTLSLIHISRRRGRMKSSRSRRPKKGRRCLLPSRRPWLNPPH